MDISDCLCGKGVPLPNTDLCFLLIGSYCIYYMTAVKAKRSSSLLIEEKVADSVGYHFGYLAPFV